MKKSAIIVMLFVLAGVCGVASCTTQQAQKIAQTSQTATRTTETHTQPNSDREAYFGETHIHTSWSVDAWLFQPYNRARRRLQRNCASTGAGSQYAVWEAGSPRVVCSCSGGLCAGDDTIRCISLSRRSVVDNAMMKGATS
jgi:hypothetical protein